MKIYSRMVSIKFFPSGSLGVNALYLFVGSALEFYKIPISGPAFSKIFGLIASWLQRFAFRTYMDFAIFIYSGTALVIVCMRVVAFQSFKAAVSNPVESLKKE